MLAWSLAGVLEGSGSLAMRMRCPTGGRRRWAPRPNVGEELLGGTQGDQRAAFPPSSYSTLDVASSRPMGYAVVTFPDAWTRG